MRSQCYSLVALVWIGACTSRFPDGAIDATNSGARSQVHNPDVVVAPSGRLPPLDGSQITKLSTIAVMNALVSDGNRMPPADGSRLSHLITGLGGWFRSLTVQNINISPLAPTPDDLKHTVTIQYDLVAMEDEQGRVVISREGKLAVSLNVSGKGGLDTGTKAANTWYYLWLMNDGKETAALFSAQDKTPKLPDGFRFRALAGVVRNTENELVPFFQRNREIHYPAQFSVYTTPTGGTAARVAVDLSDFVPATAVEAEFMWLCSVQAATGGNQLCNLHLTSTIGGAFASLYYGSNSSSGDYVLDSTQLRVPLLTPQRVYLQSSNSAAKQYLRITGFRFE